ncbi:MAG: hypothetical protein Ta2A_08440 [Treponemataceae bacterium]|nr:MAG: hypothetical protein Ta2A_08440 [Treponemataceae bacterium]
MADRYSNEQVSVKRGMAQSIIAHCIKLHETGRCNDKCDKCPYNASSLCESDKEYRTLMSFELLHYKNLEDYEDSWRVKGNRAVLLAAICGIITIFLCRNCWSGFTSFDGRLSIPEPGNKEYNTTGYMAEKGIKRIPREPKPAPEAPKPEAPKPEAPKAQANVGAYTSVSTWYHNTKEDLNSDGLHDCIDASMMFVRKNPSAKYIVNLNPDTGMNHMFVLYNGAYIEPQQGKGMKEAWGKRYDPQYNYEPSDWVLEQWGVK